MWMAGFVGGDRGQAAVTFLELVGDALRRIIHRRRLYTGREDPYPTVVGFAWMARADRVMSGTRNVASEISLARDAQIDPEAYDDARIG